MNSKGEQVRVESGGVGEDGEIRKEQNVSWSGKGGCEFWTCKFGYFSFNSQFPMCVRQMRSMLQHCEVRVLTAPKDMVVQSIRMLSEP